MGVKTTDMGSNIMNRSVGIILPMALCNFSFMSAKIQLYVETTKDFL